ncbi:MAG: alpha/beta hydrolase [Pseudomonadota bacterium]
MPQIAVNGINLHYAEAGDGPPLLLLAGFASDSASWAPIAPRLGRSHKLIMPDNRGIGRSVSEGGHAFHLYADDAAALMQALGYDRYSVLGHSMGGLIALDAADRHHGSIDRVLLAATAPTIPPHASTVMESLIALREAGAPLTEWHRQFFCWLFRPAFFDNARMVDAAIALAIGYPYRPSAEAVRRQVECLRGVDMTGALSRIDAPILAIAAQHDLLFYTEELRRLFAPHAHVAFEVMEHAAHSLHWDAPDAFAARVEAFLSPGP